MNAPELSVQEHLHPAILNMYGQARIVHRTDAFVHVRFKDLHTATSWASSPEMAKRCRLRDGFAVFDQPVIVLVDVR